MRELEFVTVHMIYNLAYTKILQMTASMTYPIIRFNQYKITFASNDCKLCHFGSYGSLKTVLTTVPHLNHLELYIKIHAIYLSILTIKFNQFIIQ